MLLVMTRFKIKKISMSVKTHIVNKMPKADG
jgi:hypothetical protein